MSVAFTSLFEMASYGTIGRVEAQLEGSNQYNYVRETVFNGNFKIKIPKC